MNGLDQMLAMVDEGDLCAIHREGKPTAIVMLESEYDALVETLDILNDDETMAAIREAEDDIANGRVS